MKPNMQRIGALIAIGFLFFHMVGPVTADHTGLPGLGGTDGWVDVHGDTMYGDLDMREHAVVLNGNALRANPLGRLYYGDDPVCIQGDGECYLAGNGLALVGTTFRIPDGGVTSGLLGDGAVTASKLGIPCGVDEVLRSDGLGWTCGALPEPAAAWLLGGNSGTVPAQDFIGTTDAVPLEFRVNGERVFVIEPASSPNLIGGHKMNTVALGNIGVTIAGGGSATQPNRAFDDWVTIGGGYDNEAGREGFFGAMSTVGGGRSNTASGPESTVSGGRSNVASGQLTTVGGGAFNTAGGSLAMVGGGSTNIASGPWSTVVGGMDNTASGAHSMIPGGRDNTAAGSHSFAAGRLANANHDGAFVWRDSTGFLGFSSTAADQFRVRSIGGVEFWTNTGLNSGCRLAAGGGTWSCTSDRDAKENWQEVDSREVLERLMGVPIATWNYRSQDESIVHMGPAAQDFHAAYGLGNDDRSISQVDAAGVALAAIQGLNGIAEEQAALLDAQAKRIEDLEKRLESLEALFGLLLEE